MPDLKPCPYRTDLQGVTPSLSHDNVLTITVKIDANSSLEALYSAAERFLAERRSELRTKLDNNDIRSFLLAEQSYLEAPE